MSYIGGPLPGQEKKEQEDDDLREMWKEKRIGRETLQSAKDIGSELVDKSPQWLKSGGHLLADTVRDMSTLEGNEKYNPADLITFGTMKALQGVGVVTDTVIGKPVSFLGHNVLGLDKDVANLTGDVAEAVLTPIAAAKGVKAIKGAATWADDFYALASGTGMGTGAHGASGTRGLLASAVEDSLLLAEKSRRANLIKTGVLKDKPRGLTLKSKEEAIKFYNLDSKKASELGFAYYQKGSKFEPKWELGSKALKNRQKIVREARIKEVTSPEVMQRGLDKIKAINKKGLDPHHIIPTHVSKKIKDSMTPAQWKQRVIDDANRNIYHGNHPRNLVAARDANRIPKTTAGKESQLWHRLGEPDVENLGYHALEAKIKAMSTIDDYHLYRDMMAKQMKTRRQGERFLDQLILDYNN